MNDRTGARLPGWHATTILMVRKGGRVVIAGDGQVSLGQTVMKGNARKVRRLAKGEVIAGFAGATADAFTLFERLEGKLEQYPGQLPRACVELAKDWRTDRYLRRLEAMLLVADKSVGFVLTGSGDVLEPEGDEHGSAIAIGSGGNYALAAARALLPTDARRRGDRAPRDEHRRRHLRLHQHQSRPREPVTCMTEFSPREIVSELDRYIVGQNDAKRAVAIALRNRWRRLQLVSPMREEVMPKNILMIGPTGCGKTEIARRLAELADAPFLKVEATKFTEVGYVGRDVEQIVRDLVEIGIALVKAAQAQGHRGARPSSPPRSAMLDALVGASASPATRDTFRKQAARRRTRRQGDRDRAAAGRRRHADVRTAEHARRLGRRDQPRRHFRQGLRPAHQAQAHDASPRRTSRWSPRRADKLLDQEQVVREAIHEVESNGIVFLDEIDKICAREGRGGADVSREGVQRDLLPLIEGTTVATKHGAVKTDHILFIASGAFHVAKPSDLLPELQGRLPIRVELASLTEDDFKRILTETEASLIKQYVALLATEGVTLDFADDAIDGHRRASPSRSTPASRTSARGACRR